VLFDILATVGDDGEHGLDGSDGGRFRVSSTQSDGGDERGVLMC
jgi:hypothetical protein